MKNIYKGKKQSKFKTIMNYSINDLLKDYAMINKR